jgi:MFS family permease
MSSIDTSPAPRPPFALTAPDIPPIRLPTFRALWLGLVFMSSGVQFYAVALTWLVLELTGSSLQLGAVLAISAVPRALTMLLGGPLIDRVPPRTLLGFTALGNGVLIALLALLLTLDVLTILILVAAGAVMGLLDAFFYPSSFALVPRLVHPARLEQANALMQGADGFINMVAPAFSGLLIGIIGLPLTLAANALLFLAGALITRGLNHASVAPLPAPDAARESQLQAVLNGLRFAMQRPPVRLGLLGIALLNFAAIGPIVVGGAVLVQGRFAGGADLYGFFLGAFGVGGLIGASIATSIAAPRRPGRALVWTAVSLGLSMLVIGFAQALWLVFVVVLGSAVIIGLTTPFFSAWLQRETIAGMHGRIGSLIALSAVAVDPFSQAVAGALSQIDVTLTFAASGGLLLLVAIVLAFNRTTHMPVSSGGAGRSAP